LAAAGAAGAETPQIRVAAASNLTVVASEFAQAFEKSAGIRPVFSFASTAQLAKQIDDGAPFDLFLAADTQHVDDLIRKGRLIRDTRAVYATGILALWFPKMAGARFEDLAKPEIRTIALARPELAPYGAAAVETLRNLQLWEKTKPRIVYAGSVAMAKQYGSTGNADAVFLPKALITKEHGAVILVDEKLHQPIQQALAVVTATKQTQNARRFADFISKGPGHVIFQANGYK